MPFNANLSRMIGEDIGAKNKDCFLNAFRAISEVNNAETAVYVEGFAVSHEMRFLIASHAWIEVDGEIIDPTPAYQEGGHEYFPAVKYPRHKILVAAIENDSTLPVANLDILIDEEIREAHEQAHKYAFGMTPKELRAQLARLPNNKEEL